MKPNHPLYLLADTCVPGLHGYTCVRDSAAQCTRCNNCVQDCPSYLHNPQECFSARGRVQTVRLLAEQKLKIDADAPLIKQIVLSCSLCARCTAACPAALPVAHYMLALTKALRLQRLPFTLRLSLRLYSMQTLIFDKLVTLSLFLRRCGLFYILKPFLPAWLRHADRLIARKAVPLKKLLLQQSYRAPEQPQAVYVPSLYASYADAHCGIQTLQLLADKKVTVLLDFSTGLIEYLYGKEVWAQQAAKRLLTQWEKLSASRALPLFTDSIEVYSFLRHYPLLFAKWPGWQKRAQKMANHVKFITDILPTKFAQLSDRITVLDTSSVLYPAGAAAERARKILLTKCKKNLLECDYSDIPLPAGGTGFIKGIPTETYLRQYVQDIACRKVADVYCLSGWAALELNAVFKRLYPQIRAEHLIRVMGYGRAEKGKHATVR